MKTTPAKRPIARRMWADKELDDDSNVDAVLWRHDPQKFMAHRDIFPVIVLRADAAALEQMALILRAEIFGLPNTDWSKIDKAACETTLDRARKILSVLLGIKQRKPRK